MIIQFLNHRTDNKTEIELPWVQITYDELRTPEDEQLAIRNGEGFWLHKGIPYSDIIFGE